MRDCLTLLWASVNSIFSLIFFLWMVNSTHHVGEIWCTPKLEGVPVRLSCEKINNSYDCMSIVHRGTYFLLIYHYCGK